MRPRLSLVTLGVADIGASRGFYERLGFTVLEGSNDRVVFLDAGGVMLGLFGRAALAADAGVSDTPAGFAGVTLAHNVTSESHADAFLAGAVAAGAQQIKPAQATFWGGYAGYFADPDGHLWEVAFNPFWPMDADGAIRLSPASSGGTAS